MNKRLNSVLILTLTLFIFNSCAEEKIKPESDLKKMSISGNVKSMKETKYTSLEDFNNGVGMSELIHFDDEGYKKDIESLGSDGSLSYKTEFTYNDNHNLITERSLNSDDEPIKEIRYSYDERGRLLKADHPKDEAFYTQFTYEYDEKDNLVLEQTYNSDNTLDTKSTFTYNEKNQLIEENWFYADGALFVTLKSKYAGSGKKKYESRYRSNGNLFMSIDYNENGDESVILDYDPYSQSEVRISTAMYKIEYEYDESGNWTNQKTLENNTPSYFIGRELEYRSLHSVK
ncbi:hypothetical protein QSV08_02715 [Maribacter sp. BPC-D8]|uniref:hypothetical protein n=1 Tax=Maribacter sp. BPC-D8 TaxID=3053613 RepID=UPI002B46CC11|nr:hypothetical protein [Maribacter sp. BPC-D8]WRI30155.1 hypothetical protein QSV08_02715 [Maribacter sp. BPC-D8]